MGGQFTLSSNTNHKSQRTYDVKSPFQPLVVMGYEIFHQGAVRSEDETGEVYFARARDQLLTKDGLPLISNEQPGGLQIANVSKEGVSEEKNQNFRGYLICLREAWDWLASSIPFKTELSTVFLLAGVVYNVYYLDCSLNRLRYAWDKWFHSRPPITS